MMLWNLTYLKVVHLTPQIYLNLSHHLCTKKHRDFGYFVKGAVADSMPAWKRERKFIEMLESIHPSDAELVLSMVEKKSPVKFLTKKLVQEAFPKLITS